MTEVEPPTTTGSPLRALLEAALQEADRCASLPIAAYIAQALALIEREEEDQRRGE